MPDIEDIAYRNMDLALFILTAMFDRRTVEAWDGVITLDDLVEHYNDVAKQQASSDEVMHNYQLLYKEGCFMDKGKPWNEVLVRWFPLSWRGHDLLQHLEKTMK